MMGAEKSKTPLTPSDGKFMGQVKVGQKGQIVIPKEIRSLFKIDPGDYLFVLADIDKGIIIQRFDIYQNLFNQFFHIEEDDK